MVTVAPSIDADLHGTRMARASDYQKGNDA